MNAVVNNAFRQFTLNSTLRFLTIFDMNQDQASQLQNLRNLESLTLIAFQEDFFDFSTLTHLRHIEIIDSRINFPSIFAGVNNITSIHCTSSSILESCLRNTTKQITSLTFFNKWVTYTRERFRSLNLFTKFISSLKHVKIFLELDTHEDFNQFLKDTSVLESITVHKKDSLNSLKFMKYAHGIKYFEIVDHLITRVDLNLIRFIKGQTNLQSFTFITSYFHLNEDENVILKYLNKIVDAILVKKTVQRFNFNANVEITLKIQFTQSFYKCLLKLENLDLYFNGVPIKNVLRDLRVNDDSVFHFDEDVLTLKLNGRVKPSIY